MARLGRWARSALLAAVAVTIAFGTATGAPAITAARLKAISAHVSAKNVTLVIEATEPVPYVTMAPDPLTVLGGGSGKGYSVTYFAGTTNITSKVVAGTYKLTLGVGQSTVLKMTVKVGSTAVTARSILVKTSADHEPTRLDAVKAIVKRA